jgi:hypothetical protein
MRFKSLKREEGGIKMIRFKGISIGDIILLLTAIVVIWYSWETKGMRKEMVNQNEKLGKTLKL